MQKGKRERIIKVSKTLHFMKSSDYIIISKLSPLFKKNKLAL